MQAEERKFKIFELAGEKLEQHFEGVVNLLSEQMTLVGKRCTREEIRRALENALKPEARVHLFAAEDTDNEVIGICLVNLCSGIEASGDYVWINEIHTRSDRRTRGVGQALLLHIVNWAESIGCCHVNAITSTSNQPAQKLCRSVGFKVSNVAWLDRQLA